MKLVIIGFGQSMRGDDAAGLESVKLWKAQNPGSASQVHVVLSEVSGLSILDLLTGMDAAILVDAVQASMIPGSVICLRPGDISGFTPSTLSSHGWGLAETLRLGQSLYPSLAKCQVTLIGIIGKDFSIGKGISLEVRADMENAVNTIEREIQKNLDVMKITEASQVPNKKLFL